MRRFVTWFRYIYSCKLINFSKVRLSPKKVIRPFSCIIFVNSEGDMPVELLFSFTFDWIF